MSIKSVLRVLIGCGALAGCAGTQGVPQFQAYSRAFDEFQAVSNALYDRAAHYERRNKLIALCTQARSEFPPAGIEMRYCRDGTYTSRNFNADEAAYFVADVDPPHVAAQRQLLKIVASFNAALLAYAEGRALEPIQAELRKTAGEVELLVSAVGGTAVPVGAALKALESAVGALVSASSREAFRQILLDQYAVVDKALVMVRDGAGADGSGGASLLFTVMTADLTRAIAGDPLKGAPERALREREDTRLVLSRWVILLDRVRRALRESRDVVAADATALDAAGGLAVTAGEIRASAEATRRALAGL
ncbi:hypothetical protein HL658_25720 [Azospirillum sp. RWY-5-1]|uniref:Uncharacterized protein n=1 Tax=Azospirillum oleiclasticum TaxID=2735135 RepID=A0ABX2TGU1_9PROT|nr:hypothetical protein [Azospirillum oleiclasticum]NYZ15954.1 hypothetical protein [Azospirillum oleiclasticum]NYZ23567.1 hypothetical protein [Azospirillum oleiclasticum]